MKVLWIVGPPGVGKTSLTRELLSPKGVVYLTTWVERPKWTRVVIDDRDVPIGKTGVCAVGHYKGDPFDGGDTVPPGDIKNALAFWGRVFANDKELALTIFDGDKFSNANALEFVRERRHPVRCVHLGLTWAEAQERRNIRNAQVGKAQNAIWIKGRETKANNFFRLFAPSERMELFANEPPAKLAARVRSFVR